MGGGDAICDKFTINSTAVVEDLVGDFNLQADGALLVDDRTNKLKRLLPKINFLFKTRRNGHKPRVSLTVKGVIGMLLPAQAGLEPQFKFAKKFDNMPNTCRAYELAFKVALERAGAPAGVSQAVREFISMI